jgi:hypothetical protein
MNAIRAAAFAAALLAGLCITPAQAQNAFGIGICAHQYDPVCARSKKRLITYANACLAANDRAVVLARGVCPQGCPRIYKPVCAAGADGQRHTYPNACVATLSEAKIVRNGRCLPFFR